MQDHFTRPSADIPRRRFVQGLAGGGAIAALGLGARRAEAGTPPRIPVLTGQHFDLSIGRSPADFTGRPRMATTVNGSLPGPTLRFREGDASNLEGLADVAQVRRLCNWFTNRRKKRYVAACNSVVT